MRVIDWNTSLKWEESCREGERASEKGEKRGEKKEEGGDMMEWGIKTLFLWNTIQNLPHLCLPHQIRR